MQSFPGAVPRPPRLPSTGRIAEVVQDVRDMEAELSDRGGSFDAMLHWPRGPPVQVHMMRHWSFEDMHLAASEVIEYLGRHADLSLHLPGALPRGTNATLHFLVERDFCCGEDCTLYLLDGRALQPDGPPFRTLLRPRRQTASELLQAAGALFYDALAPLALRVNGRLTTGQGGRLFDYPLIRLLAGEVEPAAALAVNDSCIPSLAVADLFPSIAVDLQHFETPAPSAVSAPSQVLAMVTRHPSAYQGRAFRSGHDGDLVPLGFEFVPLSFLFEVVEHIVVSTHFPAFRLSVPAIATSDILSRAIAEATGVPVVALRWPVNAPALAGDQLFVVAIAEGDDREACLGIVDARRLHPVRDTAFWVVAIPAEVSSSHLTALALQDHQVCVTPSRTCVDGRRCNGQLVSSVAFSSSLPL